MKKVAFAITALCAVLAPGLHAQDKQISIGADVALPNGGFHDDASVGAGPAVGFEFPMGSRSGLTLQLACDFMTPTNETESFESWIMVPFQIGGKYYFEEDQKGFHLDVMGGTHNQLVNTTETDDGATLSGLRASWGAGLGFQQHKIDVSARYTMISDNIEGANWSYMGFRLAYLIHLRKKTE